MMVDILDPKEGETIYDPACGTGGMLLGAIEHVQRAGGDPRTFFGKIYGQEKNLTTSSIARMNLVLHGIEDFQIVREDTLRNPAFTDSSTGGLATFDCVIANPPFSLKEWGARSVGGRPVGPRLRRPAAGELRRLRLGAAHGRVDGRRDRPHGGRAAAGRALPQGRRGPDPQAAPRARPDRGRHRPGAEPLLRHRPRARASWSSADRSPPSGRARCWSSTPRASSARAAPRTSSTPSTPSRSSPGCAAFEDVEDRAKVVDARRDRGRRLDAQHLALRAAADRRGRSRRWPRPSPRSSSARRGRAAEDHAARSAREGGWLA